MDEPSILSSAGTRLFSGDGESDFDWNDLTRDDTTRDRMESAQAEHRPMVAHRNRDLNLDNRTEGLPGGHAYTVVAYDRGKDAVTLRNPWGKQEHEESAGVPADKKNDGTFTLSMEEYDRLFTGTNYANAPLGAP